MADQWYGAPSGPGERWNVNLPAVIGVVFVFLLGVVIWVIASSRGGDETTLPGIDSTLPQLSGTTAPPTSLPTTQPTPATSGPAPTTPLPMPSLTAAPTVPATAPTVPPTEPPTVPPTTAATTPATTLAPLPTAPPEQGDLGVAGHPIQRPPCDGGYITVIGSAIGDEATRSAMDAVLDRYSGSYYLRTDQSCPSLTQSKDGEPIYVVYFGPFVLDTDACAARAQGPAGSYVRQLSSELSPDHSVRCG
jgi:serine/threonine-protein kinase